MKKGIAKAIWSYDNRNVISINYEKRLDIFDIEKGVNKLNYEHDKYLTSLINHPTDSNIIITGSKNEILAWDLRKKLDNPIKYYRFLFGQSLDTIFLPNNEIFINSGDLISQSADEPNLLAWDFKSAAIVSNQIYKEKYSCPKLLTENTGHPAKFYAQTNGNYIAIFSVRPPYKMNKRKRFQGGHTVDGFSVDMDQTPNSKYLISGSSDGKIYIYNSNTTSLFSSLDLNSRDGSWNSKNPDSKAITALSIHPNYSSLVGVGDFGGNLRLITI
ncbi:unnamed protein product [Gordionus sp. m RMFG-2023]|uniref:WD repeat-containing protein 25-like isoform X1 n=1 Tax=Gordionus sp. m RMFG-2023 TaxID=3053472 RepID=UPI0030E2E59C